MGRHCCERKRTTADGRTTPFRGEGGKVCNRRVSSVAVRPGEGPLIERTAATQSWRRERVFMPLSNRSLPATAWGEMR
jgi:hypothetical protein